MPHLIIMPFASFVGLFFTADELSWFIFLHSIFTIIVIFICMIHGLLFKVLGCDKSKGRRLMKDALLLSSFFVIFFIICGFFVCFMQIILFQPEIIYMRIESVMLSIFLVVSITVFIFLIKTKGLLVKADASEFFFNMLSFYLFILLLLTPNYFMYIHLPFKYVVLSIFLGIFFIKKIVNFYNNIWKDIMIKSSNFILLLRLSNITPLMLLSEASVPGSSIVVCNGIIFFPVPSSEIKIPIMRLLQAALHQDAPEFKALSIEHKVPERLGISPHLDPSQKFVHTTYHAMKPNESKDLIFGKVKSVSPNENALVVTEGQVLENLALHLKKFKDPLLFKENEYGLWIIYVEGLGMRELPEHVSYVIDRNLEHRNLFVPTKNNILGECFRSNLGDAFAYNVNTGIIESQTEFKTVHSPEKVGPALKEFAKEYEGVGLQLLDRTNQIMYDKSAASNDVRACDLSKPVNENLITSNLESSNKFLSNKANIKDHCLGEKLVENKFSSIREYE